jgi:uncharacterized membrane protein YfcA
MPDDFAFFLALGFLAQVIDGALGLAYGLITTSVLLASGVPAAGASAAVHAAEVVTTGFSGAAHVWQRNIDWSLVRRLAPAGILGGVIGAYVLTEVPEQSMAAFVTVYLLGMAILILRRAWTGETERGHRIGTEPIGFGGGFLDAVGGGGWGSIVTSSLIARGEEPRQGIGSANLAEFFVTLAISATFVAILDWTEYATVVAGLVTGGAIAAPMAAWLSRTLPKRLIMVAVAALVVLLAAQSFVRLGSS